MNPASRTFRIGILTEGSAQLNDLALHPGESFMIPYDAESVTITGKGTILFVLPPVRQQENSHA